MRRDWQFGDVVIASPVGAGELTGSTEVGYPQVDGVAVTWMIRDDGAYHDPHSRLTPEIIQEHLSNHLKLAMEEVAIKGTGSNVIVGPWENKKG